jgi:hypothetical protein
VRAPSRQRTIGGSPGSAGGFLVFPLHFEAVRGPVDVNPLYFYVTSNGRSYDVVVDGGRQPQLNTGVLPRGRKLNRFLTVEAPIHGQLVYAPDRAHPVARWPF